MDDALRRDLLARCEADQVALTSLYRSADRFKDAFYRSHAPSETPWLFAILEWEPEDEAPRLVIEALSQVRENTTFLKQLVADTGWPGRDRVGEDGADAAWLLLQHAGAGVRTLDSPANRAFRHQCVALLHEAVTGGFAHPRHLAHTVDGIRFVEGQSPVYAVLPDAFVSDEDGIRLSPGLDVLEIERSRRSIGLVPVAEDQRLRAAGRPPGAAGGDQPEPWMDL